MRYSGQISVIITACGLFIIQLLGSRCSNEVDVTGKLKDVPVVYGFLNTKDTAHYIKVTRAFLDEDSSAVVMAKKPSALYYDNLSVRLMEIRDSQVVKRIHLEKVRGEEEGYPMEEGMFARTPNILYKTTHPIVQQLRYRLVVDVPETGKQVTATIPIVDTFDVTVPTTGVTIDWTQDDHFILRWISGSDGKVYEADAIFRYERYNYKTGVRQRKKIRWTLFRNKEAPSTKGGERMQFPLNRESFFRVIGARLDSHQFVIRRALRMDIEFWVAGRYYQQYRRVSRGQHFSLASTKSLPRYTNLSEGRGLFASRTSVRVDSILLSSTTFDSLECGRFTEHLNFVQGNCNN